MKDNKKILKEEDVFDLDWEEELSCAHCGDELEADEGIEVKDKLYCEYCYKNYCYECPECGEEFCQDDDLGCSGATEDAEEDVYYCHNCWEKIFFECSNCGDIFYKDYRDYGVSVYVEEGGETYCKDCAESYLGTPRCIYCDNLITDESIVVEYLGDTYCKFCFEEALGGFVCAGCGRECTEDDGEEGEDGERYCYDCLEEIEEE